MTAADCSSVASIVPISSNPSELAGVCDSSSAWRLLMPTSQPKTVFSFTIGAITTDRTRASGTFEACRTASGGKFFTTILVPAAVNDSIA